MKSRVGVATEDNVWVPNFHMSSAEMYKLRFYFLSVLGPGPVPVLVQISTIRGTLQLS